MVFAQSLSESTKRLILLMDADTLASVTLTPFSFMNSEMVVFLIEDVEHNLYKVCLASTPSILRVLEKSLALLL